MGVIVPFRARQRAAQPEDHKPSPRDRLALVAGAALGLWFVVIVFVLQLVGIL